MKKYIMIVLFLFSASYVVNAQDTIAKQTETMVLISTDLGNIRIKLYNETPKHRDNFINLVKEGKYDSSIFHRVIPQFMIQGGGGRDGSQDLATPVPAEIVTKFVHTRGALAAARMGDNVNPQRNSSGSQFYIVQGRSFSATDIEMIGSRTGFTYTQEQKDAYVKNGGAPHLDGAYTIFGEVIEGMDVVDKIAEVQRNPMDRPLTDIKMTMKLVTP